MSTVVLCKRAPLFATVFHFLLFNQLLLSIQTHSRVMLWSEVVDLCAIIQNSPCKTVPVCAASGQLNFALIA